MTSLGLPDWIFTRNVKSPSDLIKLPGKRMQGFSFGYFYFEIRVREQDGTTPTISGLKI